MSKIFDQLSERKVARCECCGEWYEPSQGYKKTTPEGDQLDFCCGVCVVTWKAQLPIGEGI